MGSKSLLDLIREGGNVEEAARQLLQLVHREQRQRDRLKGRRTWRPPTDRP
jgi:hypothetical protein